MNICKSIAIFRSKSVYLMLVVLLLFFGLWFAVSKSDGERWWREYKISLISFPGEIGGGEGQCFDDLSRLGKVIEDPKILRLAAAMAAECDGGFFVLAKGRQIIAVRRSPSADVVFLSQNQVSSNYLAYVCGGSSAFKKFAYSSSCSKEY